MDLTFGDLLTHNRVQLQYAKSLFEKRGENREESLIKFLPEIDSSLVEVAYHATNPLYVAHMLLKNPKLASGDIKMPAIEGLNPSETVLSYYKNTLDLLSESLQNADFKNLQGELRDLSSDKEKITKWIATLSMHAQHHFGQILRWQGIIESNLQRYSLATLN